MAHHYEKKNAHYLAAPLFLQAITYADPKSCHVAVLSTLAASLHSSPQNANQIQ